MRPTIFLMKSLGRRPQNEKKVPFKVQMPLALKNNVTSKGSSAKEHGCLYEISLVLGCLEQNNFENKFCAKEVSSFHQCYANYLNSKNETKEHARKGTLIPNSKSLKYNQINQLMKKYPHV